MRFQKKYVGSKALAAPLPCLDRRFWFGALAVLALLLQMLAPLAAQAGTGTWIEICSDDGVRLIKVAQPHAPEQKHPHQKGCPICMSCADCLLCEAGGLGLHTGQPEIQRDLAFAAVAAGHDHQISDLPGSALWPETRGPPACLPVTGKHAYPAFRASIQSKGGAL